MNRLQAPAIIILVLAFWPNFTSLDAAETSWMCAAGSVAITPQDPVWMGGYAARKEPSAGIVHDLNAKVLVIRDEQGEQLIIVTLDLLGITKELRIAVEERVLAQGVSPNSLLLNASHTHCGPELRDARILRYGIDATYAASARAYVHSTAIKIGNLITETLQRLEPANLYYSRARAGFAMNRRLPTEQGFINSPNPKGPIDHDVPVLRVENAQGKLTAVLFGYACHATTLSFQKLCGDYPGFAQQYIEAKHEGVTALFLNGCSADQNPYPRRTLELAKQHGQALANGVETALTTKQYRKLHGPLLVEMGHATLDFKVPSIQQINEEANSDNKYTRVHGEELLRQIETRGRIDSSHSDFPIQVAQFGADLTLVAICGEVVVDYSLRLKQELGQDDHLVWVAGYSNHVFGYLPSLRVLREGGYEGGGAMQYTTYPGPFEATVEERVIEKIRELHRKIQSKRTTSQR